MHPLLIIVGPTGSGKTALSLALAEGNNAEIVSCDSVAVYREFEIGTAKPSREDRRRLPHHMIDVVSPEEEMTAGRYAREGRATLAAIRARGAMPIVVGGTGLYLRALEEGLFAGPARSEALRERLRASAARRGTRHLHRVLRRVDADAARRIHVNDAPKLIRALEVCFAAKASITALHEQGRDPLTGFRTLSVGLEPERETLYARINARSQAMYDRGLIEETRDLLARYPQLLARPNSPLNALGYKQAVQHMRGELTIAQAKEATAQAHRNYAKRQLTWFRNQHRDVRWLRGSGDEKRIQEQAQEILADFLR